ncbi:unnamed protein product [Vicia faba]|uniref:Uncharacterized protein n=1 Tax=Vicia faba TaxID=3906 RepID=A0AAV0YHS3_VICFA|nr:unnamed protein product [Vicia faba]
MLKHRRIEYQQGFSTTAHLGLLLPSIATIPLRITEIDCSLRLSLDSSSDADILLHLFAAALSSFVAANDEHNSRPLNSSDSFVSDFIAIGSPEVTLWIHNDD